MLDPVILIDVIFVVTAVIYGFGSRNFVTAAVAGIWLGLIHAALLALIAAHSGGVTELPYLKNGVDIVMTTGYLDVVPARLPVYLFGSGLALLIGMIALYLVKWALASLVGLVTPPQRDPDIA